MSDGVICMSGHLAVVQLLAEAQPQAALATCRRDKNIQENSSSIPSQQKLETPVIFKSVLPRFHFHLFFFKSKPRGKPPKTTCKGGQNWCASMPYFKLPGWDGPPSIYLRVMDIWRWRNFWRKDGQNWCMPGKGGDGELAQGQQGAGNGSQNP